MTVTPPAPAATAAPVAVPHVTEATDAAPAAEAFLPPTVVPKHAKLGGYDLYRSIGSPKYVVAPMVDASELPWRLLSRAPLDPELAGEPETITGSTGRTFKRYKGGAHLSYTPMIHARVFSESRAASRGGDPQFNLTFGEEGSEQTLAGIEGGDRPLFVQFCANDPDVLLAAAKKVEDRCDAVDINFGCPQGIARKGHYGSFLQDEWDLVAKLISTLHENLKCPVTAKFRIFPEVEKTIRYAKMMEAAGAQILTCHGRTRDMKGQFTGLADWEQIKAVKAAVNVPVFANGNILYREDVDRCLELTGVDGVMTAEGNLSNPALFMDADSPHAFTSSIALANRYLDIVDSLESPTSPSAIKSHMFRVLRPILDKHDELRVLIGKVGLGEQTKRIAHYRECVKTIASYVPDAGTTVAAPPIDPATGYRELPIWIAQPYIRPTPVSSEVGGVAEFEGGVAATDGDASAGPSRAMSPAPNAKLLSSQAARMAITNCAGPECKDAAASRCSSRACLVHCRQIRAIEGGMDPIEAAAQALAGGLVGVGCEAHESKAAERSKRRKEKYASREEARKDKRRKYRQRSRSRERERKEAEQAEGTAATEEVPHVAAETNPVEAQAATA